MSPKHNESSSKTLPKLRSLNVFSISRSNQPLSESEHVEMNALLSEGETELADMIEADKEDLERHIRCIKSLSAPIRKIPPEILSAIFIEHGTLNHISECTDIPAFKLAHVSSYWRSVALSTVALWRETLIETSSPVFHAHHISLIRDILSRSLESPLHVHIVATPNNNGLHPAVPLLFEHVARWKYLRIIDRLTDGFQSNILEDLSPIRGRLTGLTNFVSSSNEYTSLLGNNSTNLRAVVIGSFEFTPTAFPFAHLNQFQVQSSPNSEIVQALPHLPKGCVVHVRYPLRSSVDDDDDGEGKATGSTTIYDNIVRLVITMGNKRIEEEGTEELLSMLELPNLTALTFVNEKPLSIRRTSPAHRWSANSIPSLLSYSCSPLTELSFIRIWVPDKILLSLIENLRTLKVLRIEEPTDSPDFAPMLSAHFFGHLKRRFVPRLSVLILGANYLTPDLQWLLVQAVHSRWMRDEVDQLDRLQLTLREGTLDCRVVDRLVETRASGLWVSVIDSKGDELMVKARKRPLRTNPLLSE